MKEIKRNGRYPKINNKTYKSLTHFVLCDRPGEGSSETNRC